MSGFAIALEFEKGKKNISLVHLDKNYLDEGEEYISEPDFVARVYSKYTIDEQNGILDKLRLFKSNNRKVDEIVFINQTACKSGRDIIRYVSCIEKIKREILEDDTIPNRPE